MTNKHLFRGKINDGTGELILKGPGINAGLVELGDKITVRRPEAPLPR